MIQHLYQIVFLLMMFTHATVAYAASPVRTLQNLYEKADFKKCSRLGKSITKRKEYKRDWPKVYKYLGICQYMLKNKTSAELSFRKGLRYKSSLKINSSEVLDTSVINFFNKLKSAELAAKARRNRAKATKKANARKKTTLLVKSNVEGTIFLNGIFAGQTNKRIDSDPGKATIEITATGFRTRKFKINIVKFAQNQFTANLQKPRPKRQPAPERVVRKKAPVKVTPDKSIDLFDDEQERALASRDLASEFENEKASGGSVSYQPVQPGYQAPPQTAYPQPNYPVAQPVYPQPVYTPAPPQPVFVPPTTTTVVQSAPPPNYDNDVKYSEPRKRRRKKSTPTDTLDPFVKLLPLGIPQFMRGDYFFGTLVGGAQAGALYFWFTQKQQAEDFELQARAAVETIRSNSEATPEQRAENEKTYLDQANPIIADLQAKSNYGLIGFFVLWGGGAAEAFLNTSGSDSASIEHFTDTELAWINQIEPQSSWQIGVRPDMFGDDHLVGMSLKLDF